MTANGTTATTNRRTIDAVHVFHAPDTLVHNLQKLLVDRIELHLQGKQAHWNLVGTNFRDLHLQFDEIVDAAREAADAIAERMRALDAVPDGRTDTVVATTSLPRFPANEQNTTDVVDRITTRIYATVNTIRTVHDAVDSDDPTPAAILNTQIHALEKLAWLIKSENRAA